MIDLNANEATVRQILGELNTAGYLTSGNNVYLVGDKIGQNPKILSSEQMLNFVDSGDYTEDYMEDDYLDMNDLITWIDSTRND